MTLVHARAVLGIVKILFSLSSLSKNLTMSITSTRLLRWLNHADHSRAQRYSLMRKTTTWSPEPELPLSSGTGNGRSGKSWFRFNCAFVKLLTHLTKKPSRGNFPLHAHWNIIAPLQYFLYVTFDRCIKWLERTVLSQLKGLLRRLKKYTLISIKVVLGIVLWSLKAIVWWSLKQSIVFCVSMTKSQSNLYWNRCIFI